MANPDSHLKAADPNGPVFIAFHPGFPGQRGHGSIGSDLPGSVVQFFGGDGFAAHHQLVIEVKRWYKKYLSVVGKGIFFTIAKIKLLKWRDFPSKEILAKIVECSRLVHKNGLK